jgi:RNA polymerase sigma-70 factor (ECF subfamily)
VSSSGQDAGHDPEQLRIRAAAAGDEVAFAGLVRELQPQVWRFLCHQLGDPALAEDVLQETFVRVHRHLATFEGRARLSTWVLQIARNAAVDAVRSRDRRNRLVRSIPPPAATTPGPEAASELREALASLDPARREALLAVEVQGLTYREAGDLLGVPEGTVKSRVHLARAQLVAWLRSDEAPEVSGRPAVEVHDDV